MVPIKYFLNAVYTHGEKRTRYLTLACICSILKRCLPQLLKVTDYININVLHNEVLILLDIEIDIRSDHEWIWIWMGYTFMGQILDIKKHWISGLHTRFCIFLPFIQEYVSERKILQKQIKCEIKFLVSTWHVKY